MFLKKRGVQVEPMAGDVYDHRKLEKEHEGGVEGAQGAQQAHRGTP